MFPAHAGMNRDVLHIDVRPTSVPRTRGDEPHSTPALDSLACVFPAHAGMNRSKVRSARRRRCVPRTRGDEPLAWQTAPPSRRCSPHTRG